MKKLRKNKSGFTLIEMTVVLFIISLLILIVLPNIAQQRSNAKTIHGNAMVEVVQTQIDLYENEHQKLPTSLDELEEGGYLTEKQVSQAEENHISIKDNKAVK
ncbi:MULTISPECIES: competence type IV pilus major pilin ComGC [Pediococcus]|jgi:competence protein ComGC|uniref:Competence protein ComGC n=1 Tax=Pediococcus parvulus TaxID=54062 RepID=A0A176TH53_9LACO|nr:MULTISPECIES: competence type IV pilus major pilin ComGC [Pediococcus]MCT3027885.1 prepilin-type N-terminal cleavage/methylation domain-containing protein [Pediococcus parvulus]MCT3028816.1 prepilin-type N-terminal cleavage/methylation domain-containing protein [Pediococcus parvulus]MCT3030447.1 prepilin-type N-terminal cleavage/methylation domain-containing protein [Pediococcus parvulus]MCT3035660.1 prepilin-type N-terminal cleavage/methylation domain-containing protein [Pediococcus parvulu